MQKAVEGLMYVLLEASKRMVCSLKWSLLHREDISFITVLKKVIVDIPYVATEISCTADSDVEKSVKLVCVD